MNTKRTPRDAKRIRDLYERGYSFAEIARSEGLHPVTVKRTVENKFWCEFDTTKMSILERVGEARQKAYITRDATAHHLQIDEGVYQQIEDGKLPLTVEHLLKLADLCHVSPVWLFSGAHGAMKGNPLMTPRGALHWQSQLSFADVEGIRMWADLGYSQREIAQAYGVGLRYVGHIVNRLVRVNS